MERATLSRRVSLTVVLAAIAAALVLLVAAALLGVATTVLRRLGDQQAIARVELAGAAALEQVRHAETELATSARLLAERPTLQALVASGDSAGAAAFLARFCATGELDGCAVIGAGREGAESGAGLDWPSIAARATAAERSAPPGATLRLAGDPLLLVASAPLGTVAGARAVTVKRLDDALLRSLSERLDLSVAVLPAGGEAGATTVERELRAAAIAGGRAARRLTAIGAYRDIRVLRDDELPVALIETCLPTAAVDRSLGELARRLLLFSALVTVVAAAVGIGLGRALARPLRDMAASADRIGAGDFDVAVPEAAGAELGTLSRTMDHMRRQLRRLTSELERREAEAQAVLGGIVEGVFAVDGDRRIRYLNPQAAQLLGVAPDQALGRFCGDVLDPQGLDGVRPCGESCPIVHARSLGSTRATERLRLADGSLRTTVITSAPPAEGRQMQVLRDETDVEAARRLRDAILANVSHEFKTPLSAQLASIELLRDGLDSLGGTDARQLVASLERGTLRLTQLVDNLLESVRIEAGAPALRSSPVSLEAVVDAAAELLEPLFAQRGQRLVVDLPAALPELQGDPPRLTQVFVNLLANANKFAPSGSEVRVSAEARGAEVTLWVEDAGPGVPVDANATLFERFARAPHPEPAGGMGLGLWIVKSIVEAHGGRVEARNRSAGGTRFSITLPATERA
jgi:signal transduction histidine kinase